MTRSKTIAVLGTIIIAVGAISFSAFAASNYKTPAEAVAGLTGKTVESVIAQRVESNKTYGTIADEAGKLDEFKDEMIEIKKNTLSKRVEAGTMTQAQADEVIAAITENQANCDGTGDRIGQEAGARFGGGNGQGQNRGQGKGQGQGMGQGGRNGSGRGQGNGTGVCTVQ